MLRDIIDKVKYYWFILMVVLVPCAYPPMGGEMRPFQEHFFQWMSIGLIALFLENIWLTLFLIYNVILYLAGGGVIGSMQTLNILFGCLLFRFSRSYFSKHDFSMMYKPILFTLCISMVFMVMQFLHIDMINMPQTGDMRLISGTNTQPVGIFSICFAHALFMDMCMPILATTFSWGWIPALLLLIPIYLCKSSAAMLAALIIILVYSYFRYDKFKKWILGITAILIILGGLYIYHDYRQDPGTMKSRFPMWSAVIKSCFNHPEGYGPDSFRNFNTKKHFIFHSDVNRETMIEVQHGNDTLISYYSPSNDSAKVSALNESLEKNGFPKDNKGISQISTWDNPHQILLTILFEYGFFGLFLFFGLCRDIIIRFMRSSQNMTIVTVFCCLLIFPFGGLTEFPIHIARLAVFLPIFGGAFYALTEQKGAINGYGKK
jgi:hypothetical protein